MALSQAFLEWEQKTEQRGLQQGLEQGQKKAKLESIPRLFQLGLSIEQIAEALELPIAEVENSILTPEDL